MGPRLRHVTIAPQSARDAVHGERPRLVLVHGFGQDHSCWWGIGEALAERAEVVAVDLPGHGAPRHAESGLSSDAPVASAGAPPETPSTTSSVDFRAVADALRAVCAEQRPATLVGYSMGARVALRAALDDRKGEVGGLVLIGATAGIADGPERERRRLEDEALAAEIERRGARWFAERWERTPVLAGQPAELVERQRAVRMSHDPAALAAALRGLGPGAVDPMWPELDGLGVPTLLLAGAQDGRYLALADRIATSVPRSATEVIADAGHAAHLEQPARTARAIDDWLTGLVRAEAGDSRR